MIRIIDCNCKGIVKNRLCFLEADTMPSLIVAGFLVVPLITILSDTGADVSIDGMDFFLFRVLPSSELPAPFLLTVNPGRVVDSNIAPYALPTIQIAVDIAHPASAPTPYPIPHEQCRPKVELV